MKLTSIVVLSVFVLNFLNVSASTIVTSVKNTDVVTKGKWVYTAQHSYMNDNTVNEHGTVARYGLLKLEEIIPFGANKVTNEKDTALAVTNSQYLEFIFHTKEII